MLTLVVIFLRTDPTAELQVARRKIAELEDVNNHYKTEVCFDCMI